MFSARTAIVIAMIDCVSVPASAQGYSGLHLSTDEISTLSVLGVTPEYVQEMRAVQKDLSAEDIAGLYTLKVSPQYVQDMRAQVGEVSIEDILTLSVLNVPAEYVRKIRDSGPPGLSMEEIGERYVLQVPASAATRERTLNPIPEINIHIPEIHIPEIKVHIPEPHGHASHFDEQNAHIVKVHTGPIARSLGMVLLMAIVAYVVYRRRSATPTTENLEMRMTSFTDRVTDLQDILLSINDRLDRRANRTPSENDIS